jgi:hypothetical protein
MIQMMREEVKAKKEKKKKVLLFLLFSPFLLPRAFTTKN